MDGQFPSQDTMISRMHALWVKAGQPVHVHAEQIEIFPTVLCCFTCHEAAYQLKKIYQGATEADREEYQAACPACAGSFALSAAVPWKGMGGTAIIPECPPGTELTSLSCIAALSVSP